MLEDKENITLYSRKSNCSLKKRFIKFTTIGLSIAIIMGGTSYYLKKNKTNDVTTDYSYNNGNINYNNDNIAFEITSGDDPVSKKKFPETYVNISYDQYNKYINYIKAINVSYEYEEMYGIDEAVKRYKPNDVVVHSHDITNNSDILTSTMVYERVKENNKDLFNDKKKSAGIKKLKNSYIKKVCKLLVESINNELTNNPDINRQEVYCILYDLKITGKNVTFCNAYYDNDNILVVDEGNIEKYQFFNKDVDAFRQVISHEAMHIIQSACKDNEDEKEMELGICHYYDDLIVNPFYWSWFTEAAAEKEMANILNEEPKTYFSQIGYYDSVILCSILNNNVDVSDVKDICFDKKSESLFKVFDCTTNEEKKEIIKMMYSIEIMQQKPEDFFEVYKKKYGVDLYNDSEALENLRLSLRIDILQTLSKQFYKSLSTQLLTGKITLNTVFYLINVYESDVFIHLFYNEKERIKSAVDFFDFYTEVQDYFFTMISHSINYEFSEIVDMFNNYSMNVSYNGNTIKNYNLDSLGSYDADFIETKRIQNYQTGIPTIRSMPAYCEKNGYTK